MTATAPAPPGAATGQRLPTAAEVAELSDMLEQQRSFRIEQLAALEHTGRDPLGSADDEIAISLATGARAALRDVTAALERIAAGRYGTCVACGRPVGVERLEILPQVAQCMSCQRAEARASETCGAAAGGVGSPA